MATITYLRVNLPHINYLVKGVGDDEDILLTYNVPSPISAKRAVGWLGSPDFKVEFESGDLDNVEDNELEWYSEKSGTKSVKSFRQSVLPKKKTVTQTVVEAITPKKVERVKETVEEIVLEESSEEVILTDDTE